MLVIEGRTDKALEVSQILKNVDVESTLFINISEISNADHALERPVTYVLTRGEGVWETVDHMISNIGNFRKFKTIVFYANCSINDVKHIRTIEAELGARCIVTVQNDELKKIKIYEI